MFCAMYLHADMHAVSATFFYTFTTTEELFDCKQNNCMEPLVCSIFKEALTCSW